MKLEGWVEIAVGTVILGTLGYVAVKVIDTSERIGAVDGKLGSVDTKVTFTSDRVERIANALPEMRIHIAEDEIKRQIKTAVVSTKPTQSADGKWKVIVNVIDPVASARWTFPVSLPSRDDRSALYSLIGTGADADTTYMSAA